MVKVPHIHKMSVQRPSQLRPLPQLKKRGDLALLRSNDWQSRSWECDPRQLIFTFSHGNEQHMQPIKLGTPDMFWQYHDLAAKGPGWVMGTFAGEAGQPTGPITWTPLANKHIPSRLEGLVARTASNFGHERGMENIVACRAEGKDIVVTHISQPADRKLIVLNPDGRKNKKNHSEREKVIEILDRISPTDVDKTEMLHNGKTVVLRLHSDIIDSRTGRPYYHDLDITFLGIDPSKVYHNPKDGKLSIKIILPCQREDFEAIDRERAAIYYTQSINETNEAVVRGFKDEQNILHLIVEHKASEKIGLTHITGERLDNGAIKLTVADRHSRDKVSTVTINDEAELRASSLFQAQQTEIGNALIRVFQDTLPVEIKGSSIGKIKSDPAFKRLTNGVSKAAAKTLLQVDNTNNFSFDRPTKVRPRYVIQFYNYRESRLKNVLAKPLAPGESVVVTRVLSSAKVVHLNEANGQKRGFKDVVPLNFDPTHGHPEDYEMMVYDARPNAIYSTRFVDPISSAIAPQHLIDPYVMGTEIMSAVWPKVDQLGFFGAFMRAGMAFPYGAQFADPANVPWYVRNMGTISHSIFDQKSEAGKDYYFFTGNRLLHGSHELVGAAMVTGPNIDSINPAREGRLFYTRLPGRRPFTIRTAMPGFYLTVIEDAQLSYMEMRMFGLKTATTVLPLSAGGGLYNYQTALGVQRAQRWNAGIAIWLLDGAERVATDFVRGSRAYRFYYNHTRKIWAAKTKAIEGLKGPAKTTAAPKTRATDPKAPVQKTFKWNEWREWLGVGSWYFVGVAKRILYVGVPIMILTTLFPLPVAGTAFLYACLASTIFGWPFWAAQMSKVSVDPKTIFSFLPRNLFWNDLAYDTMNKSGLDNERMSLGRFRISQGDAGNRILPNDKRDAFWKGGVLPSVAGGAMLSLTFGMMMAFGAKVMAISASPFLAGILASRTLSRWLKRKLPNPDKKSGFRTFVHWAARNVPLAAGIGATIWVAPNLAAMSIPMVTALMAGGWALFMGINTFNNFKIYHKEQRMVSRLPAPNPLPGNIQPHQADTWRNTLREAFGIRPPVFLENEFTSNNGPLKDPYILWNTIEGRKVSDALGDPAYSEIKDFLIKHSLLSFGERVSRYYAPEMVEEALKADRLSAAEFSRKYGITAKDLRETLADCQGVKPNLLAKVNSDPLVNLNNLISGEECENKENKKKEDIMIDLYHELNMAKKPVSSWWRRRKMKRLAKKTAKDRAPFAVLPRSERKAKTLTAEQYERWRELNRLVLEEVFPAYTPIRGGK